MPQFSPEADAGNGARKTPMPKSTELKTVSEEHHNSVSSSEHRTGTDRARRAPSGSPVRGNSAASAPDNKQAVSATNRILQRLTELDSHIAGLTQHHSAPAQQISESLHEQTQVMVQVAESLKSLQCSLVSAVTDAIDERLRQQSADAAATPEHRSAPDAKTATDEPDDSAVKLPPSSWNEIRSQFLSQHSEVAATKSISEEPIRPAKKPIELQEQELESPLPDYVTVVDPDALNEVELRAAVVNQERTISALVKRLQQQNRRSQILTAEQLAEVIDELPEQLAARATESLNALDRQLRYGELELSLERARVARQTSRLETTRERLEARARAMGLEIAEDGSIEGGGKTAVRGSRARNWLGAMGFGN